MRHRGGCPRIDPPRELHLRSRRRKPPLPHNGESDAIVAAVEKHRFAASSASPSSTATTTNKNCRSDCQYRGWFGNNCAQCGARKRRLIEVARQRVEVQRVGDVVEIEVTLAPVLGGIEEAEVAGDG